MTKHCPTCECDPEAALLPGTRRALERHCPKCHAGPREPCKSAGGYQQPIRLVHAARREAR